MYINSVKSHYSGTILFEYESHGFGNVIRSCTRMYIDNRAFKKSNHRQVNMWAYGCNTDLIDDISQFLICEIPIDVSTNAPVRKVTLGKKFKYHINLDSKDI